MKKTIQVFIFLILFLMVPLFADEVKLKLSFDDKPKTSFRLLQFSTWFLINADTVCTYNSTWNYGRGELNPYLRGFLPCPELVFLLHTTINLGIFWTSEALYKKNKIMAYTFLIVINVVKIYFIFDHMKMWRELNRA